MIRIGVDTGGTFTDVLRLDDRGIRVYKVRSTPHDPSLAILAGIAELMGEAPLGEVVHGSTVATNALIQHRGVKTGLITTAGFRELLAGHGDVMLRAPEEVGDFHRVAFAVRTDNLVYSPAPMHETHPAADFATQKSEIRRLFGLHSEPGQVLHRIIGVLPQLKRN